MKHGDCAPQFKAARSAGENGGEISEQQLRVIYDTGEAPHIDVDLDTALEEALVPVGFERWAAASTTVSPRGGLGCRTD